MNEETEILICKAGSGELTSSEKTRWRELCQADPQLEVLAEDFRRMSARFTEQIDRALSAPDPDVAVPPRVLERLEKARLELFETTAPARKSSSHRAAAQTSLWQSLLDQVRALIDSGGPMLVAAASVTLLAVGWVLWNSGDRPGPLVATLKNAGINPDLPIASPGATTWLVDPPTVWISVDPTPVKVSVWTGDGARELFHAEAARPPLGWDQLQPVNPDTEKLEPGNSYLIRLERGATRSEQIVTLSNEAKPIDVWLADGPEKGRALAEAWLAQSRPGDALALAGALATRYREDAASFSDLRSRALKEALKAQINR